MPNVQIVTGNSVMTGCKKGIPWRHRRHFKYGEKFKNVQGTMWIWEISPLQPITLSKDLDYLKKKNHYTLGACTKSQLKA